LSMTFSPPRMLNLDLFHPPSKPLASNTHLKVVSYLISWLHICHCCFFPFHLL
jgi:hypothetical protein